MQSICCNRVKMLLILLVILVAMCSECLPQPTNADRYNGRVVNEELNSKIFQTRLKKPSELIIKNGYGYECHKTVTQDGYILALHRIIPRSKKADKPSILFVNGYSVSAENWLIRRRTEALPFIMADEGFDVWLGDHRGTYESNEHLYLPPDSTAYWNTSLDEIATIDLPTFIDYILERSSYKQIFFAGQSIGSSEFVMMASDKVTYNNKVNAAALFAPVGIGPISIMVGSPLLNFVQSALKIYNKYSNSFLTKDFVGIVSLCYSRTYEKICLAFMNALFGLKARNIDTTMIGHYINTWGAGASVKSATHSLQILEAGRLQKYDYGERGNLREYGSRETPIYNLSRITTLLKIYYGKADLLISDQAINVARANIPNLQLFSSPDLAFGHVDSLFGINNNLLTDDAKMLFNNRSSLIARKHITTRLCRCPT